MFSRRASQRASSALARQTPAIIQPICLACRASLASNNVLGCTRSYRTRAPSPRRPVFDQPKLSSRPSDSRGEKLSPREERLQRAQKAKREMKRNASRRRALENEVPLDSDDPFYEMATNRREATSRRGSAMSSRAKASPKVREPEKDAETKILESKPPAMNLKGKASRSTLSPLNTIPLSTEPQPAESRQTMALVNSFFQTNYRFLFSSSSIQNQPLNPDTPEVVVLGASNAGKSSFLNGLFGRGDAANVSSKAGHTKTINGHGIGRPLGWGVTEKGGKPPSHGLIMVDTPGYGHKSQKDWGDQIHRYIEKRDMLKGAVLLIPAPKLINEMDRWVLRLLARLNKRTLIIITKADAGGADWHRNCTILADRIRATCRQLSKELKSGWVENDGWVPTIYATAAGWEGRVSKASAPGLAGARKAILEELAGLKIAQRKVEAAPEHKAYGGDTISWESLMGGAEEGDDLANAEAATVEKDMDAPKRTPRRRRLR